MSVAHRRRFSPLYLLIPVLYTGVIFALVYLHFSRQEPIAEIVGDIAIAGTAGRDRSLQQLALAWHGVEVPLSRQTPLLVLRDPPGDGSSASVEKGRSVTFSSSR